ncbi:hypothetical protein GCM10027073_51020 [Streptomyces chlorus]|uniref:Transposase n=1 Tax=Streptomyces chlorus TaxID=887452 RepID=A0ABW1DVY6_9ACTN
MPAPRKYPLELRERAVRMYRTAEPKPVIRRLAEELGVHHEALRGWRDMCLPFFAGVDRARMARSLFTGGRPSLRAWTRTRAVGSDGGDLPSNLRTRRRAPTTGPSSSHAVVGQPSLWTAAMLRRLCLKSIGIRT